MVNFLHFLASYTSHPLIYCLLPNRALLRRSSSFYNNKAKITGLVEKN